MKGFSAFLDMRRCKDWDHEIIPENILLSKDLLHQFPCSTECLTLHPEFPSGGVEGRQVQQHGVHSPKRQRASALVLVVQSLASALGKCQYVVDRPHLSFLSLCL